MKRRPVLILTRNEAIDHLFDLIAVPITSVVRDLPTEMSLGPDDGMPVECVLTLDNTFSAEKAFLTQRVTTLDTAKMSAVCSALSAATSCG